LVAKRAAHVNQIVRSRIGQGMYLMGILIDGSHFAIGGRTARSVARGGEDRLRPVHSRSYGNAIQPLPEFTTIRNDIGLNARPMVYAYQAAKAIPVVLSRVEGNDIAAYRVHGHVGHVSVMAVIWPIVGRIHTVWAVHDRSQLVPIDRCIDSAVAISN